jgi:hypothetical protein
VPLVAQKQMQTGIALAIKRIEDTRQRADVTFLVWRGQVAANASVAKQQGRIPTSPLAPHSACPCESGGRPSVVCNGALFVISEQPRRRGYIEKCFDILL